MFLQKVCSHFPLWSFIFLIKEALNLVKKKNLTISPKRVFEEKHSANIVFSLRQVFEFSLEIYVRKACSYCFFGMETICYHSTVVYYSNKMRKIGSISLVDTWNISIIM